jgi:hypothetical protein
MNHPEIAIQRENTLLHNTVAEPGSNDFFCGRFTKGTSEYVVIGISSLLYLLFSVFGIAICVRSIKTFRRPHSMDSPLAAARKGWRIRLTITILLVLTVFRTPIPWWVSLTCPF